MTLFYPFKTLSFIAVFAFAIIMSSSPALSDDLGRSAIKDTGARAVIYWDATRLVNTYISYDLSKSEIVRRLKSAAIRVTATHAQELPDSRDAIVCILYRHRNDQSDIYGASTFAKASTLLTVTVPMHVAIQPSDLKVYVNEDLQDI
jgi:hypothetical protein